MNFHYNCCCFIIEDPKRAYADALPVRALFPNGYDANSFTPTTRTLLKVLRQRGQLPESTKGQVRVDYSPNAITVRKRSGALVLDLVPAHLTGHLHIEPIPLDEFDF